MKKQKAKKISAKFLLAIFIINTICIFGFSQQSVATGGVGGHYPATYSFENDEIGSEPQDWLISLTPEYGTAIIISEWQNHTEALEYKDTSSSGTIGCSNMFTSGQSSGTIEFYMAAQSTSGYSGGIVVENQNYEDAIYILFEDGQIKYHDGARHNLQSYSVNIWYHIRIVFNCFSDTYDIYIDSVLVKNDASFWYEVTTLNRFCIAGATNPQFTFYLDALGYSWDPNYNLKYINDYSATYSFENDEIGSEPQDWLISFTPDHGTATIISEWQYHNEVLEYKDTSSSGTVGCSNMFTSGQSSGTIEFYMAASSISGYSGGIVIENQNYEDAIYILFEDGQIKYHDGTRHNLQAYSVNTWYHIRIGFNCFSDTYDIYIDSVLVENDASFWYEVTTLNRFCIAGATNPQFTFYLDALGYSWDPNYNIFDNFVYSDMYKILKDYDIISPQDGSTIQPTIGPFPATFGFENDEDGTDPTGWNIVETGGTVQVYPVLGNHKKVVSLFDNNVGNYAAIYNEFDSNQVSGTVEFWIRAENTIDHTIMAVYDNPVTTTHIYTVIANNKFQYYDGSWHDIASASINTWYHIRIDFECGSGGYQGLSADTFYFYIDGVQYGSYSFNGGSADDLGVIGFQTSPWATGITSYIDAVGYSWDPNYNIGDNLVEMYGILLHYNVPQGIQMFSQLIRIDSLDNPYIKYQFQIHEGYTIIPYPDVGEYTIQLFGCYLDENDEIQYCKSSLNTFQIDYTSLIGATNRRFPGGAGTRLGFILQTQNTIGDLAPLIYWGISKDIPDTIWMNLYIIVDGYVVHSISEQTSTDFFENYIEVNELKTPMSHKVEIQIIYVKIPVTSPFGENNVFTLEYLKVGRLRFTEIEELSDGRRYPSTMHYTYGPENDNAFISFNLVPPYRDMDGTTTGNMPFRPSIIVQLDPELACYKGRNPYNLYSDRTYYDYIHSVSMEYKLVNKDGISYTSDQNEMWLWSTIRTSHTNDGFPDDTMNYILNDIGTMLRRMSYRLKYPWLYATAGILGLIGTSVSPEIEEVKPINNENGLYQAYWRHGYLHANWPQISDSPIKKELNTFSMGFNFNAEPPLGEEGPYQLQISWSIDIWRTWDCATPFGGWGVEHKFTISDNYYFNCELV